MGMRYESLLAARYIKAQRRQSVFTVISIAVAVAVMTTVFLLYSVFMDCFKEITYSAAPYHLAVDALTEEQAAALQEEPHVGAVKVSRVEDGTVTAYLRFDGDIGDRDRWLQTATDHIGAAQVFQKNRYQWNNALMDLDAIGDGAHLFRLRIFAIFFIFAIIMELSLRLIVDTAFEVSSKERERHYGVLQSIGATPEQIVRIITFEGLRLCVVAVPLGLLVGIGFAYAMYYATLASGLDDLFHGMTDATLYLPFSIDPRMLLIAAVFGIVWVFLSAYGVGMRIIKKSPMEAILGRAAQVKKVKRRTLSGLLFGISGSLAARNAKRQKKRFVITVLTMTVSITMFALFSTVTQSLERSVTGLMTTIIDDSDLLVYLPEDLSRGITYEDGIRDIEESGLFCDIGIEVTQTVKLEGDAHVYYVNYLNKEMFEKRFGDSAPVSYETLVRTGGYLLNSASNEYPSVSEAVSGDTLALRTVHLTFARDTLQEGMTIREYLKSAEKTEIPQTVTVLGTVNERSIMITTGCCLVGALETYQSIHEEWYGEVTSMADAAFSYASENDYNAADHAKITDWLDAHPDTISLDFDNYGTRWRIHSVMSSVRTGLFILNVMIALAALIDLVNIISTGLADRRSELASLQCVGMTDRQLDRMAMLEVLQFAGAGAFFSAVICAAVIIGCEALMTAWIRATFTTETQAMQDMLLGLVQMDHVTPFLRVAGASVIAFAAGCVTSLVMLRTQSAESLTDQIRGTEMQLDTKRTHILRNTVIAVLGAVVLTIAGLRIYAVASFQNDRKEYEKAGYLHLVDGTDGKRNIYRTGAEDGRHTIVGLAGIGVNCFPVLTEALNERLGAENTLVYPDRAGYGLSDDSSKPQTLEQVVEDYRAALRNDGLAPPYVLMGHSYGGYYALWWELHYPDEVEAIVFLDGTELPKSALWFAGLLEEYPSEADARADMRRQTMRTWLGLDRLFPQHMGDPETGAHIYGASVLTPEQIRLWDISDHRTATAASASEMLLTEPSYRELAETVVPTSTPKLYLSTTPSCEADICEAEQFVKADREAAGLTYASDPATVAHTTWQAIARVVKAYHADYFDPFFAQIGSTQYVTIGGDHGLFYAQKPQETADAILAFLAEMG